MEVPELEPPEPAPLVRVRTGSELVCRCTAGAVLERVLLERVRTASVCGDAGALGPAECEPLLRVLTTGAPAAGATACVAALARVRAAGAEPAVAEPPPGPAAATCGGFARR